VRVSRDVVFDEGRVGTGYHRQQAHQKQRAVSLLLNSHGRRNSLKQEVQRRPHYLLRHILHRLVSLR
jgi:hypothetical protein